MSHDLGNPKSSVYRQGNGTPKFQGQSIYRVGDILEVGPDFWWVDGFVFLVG